jgi:hypothetical protein
MSATKIILTRSKTYNAMLRKAAILVDGVKVGELGNGETLEFDVQPGAHEVRARMDWVHSAPLALNAVYGQTYRADLQLCPFWQAPFALLGLAPYMTLKPV